MSYRLLQQLLLVFVVALPAAASATPETVEVICKQPCEVMKGSYTTRKSVPKVGSTYVVDLEGESSFFVRALPDGELTNVSVTAVFLPKARMVFDGTRIMPEALYQELQEEREDEEREARSAPGKPLDPPTVVVNAPRFPSAQPERAAGLQRLVISEFAKRGVNAIPDDAPRGITNHWLAFHATQFASGDQCLVSASLISVLPSRFDWGPEISEVMSCDQALVDAFLAKAAARLAPDGQRLAASTKEEIIPGRIERSAKPEPAPRSSSPVIAVNADVPDAAMQKRVVALVEEAVRKHGYSVAVLEKGAASATHLLTASLASLGGSAFGSIRVLDLANARVAGAAAFSAANEKAAFEKLESALPEVLKKLK